MLGSEGEKITNWHKLEEEIRAKQKRIDFGTSHTKGQKRVTMKTFYFLTILSNTIIPVAKYLLCWRSS